MPNKIRTIGRVAGIVGIAVYILTIILGMPVFGWNFLSAVIGSFLLGWHWV